MSAPSPGAGLPDPVVVVGCGLIGTSLALALSERGVRVQLQDVNPENVATAEALGAGSAAPADVMPQLVVVAVPPAAVAEQVATALKTYPDAVVTDVASVKGPVARAVTDARFVPGHPMAGRERSGPAAAVAFLFEGRPWVVCPGPATDPTAVALVSALAGELGAICVEVDAEVHDRSVALVSHVPQLVSSLMAGLLVDAPDGAPELAGTGLRDVTRIARSDTGLWLDIVGQNSANIVTLLGRLRDDLDGLITEIAEPAPGPLDGVREVLARGRAGTTRIPGKHGTLPADVESVYVPIDDVPGELGRLVTDVGESGVNLEDLRIDHEIGRPVGLVEIVVAPGRADVLTAALSARGWAAYR